jgi:hypothetical protein
MVRTPSQANKQAKLAQQPTLGQNRPGKVGLSDQCPHSLLHKGKIHALPENRTYYL